MADITYRGDLSRNLTADEVDANFLELENEVEAATAAITSLSETVAAKVGASDVTTAITTERTAAATLSNKTLTAPTISGVATQGGAVITTAYAMPANVIDVTKGLNTKTLSASATLTFSATPAAWTWFGLLLTNSSSSPITVTLPSSYSLGRGANITSFVIPGNGEVLLSWLYNGSGHRMSGETPYMNKLDATTAPTANDDIADGYGPGSMWLDRTAGIAYLCVSSDAGAADWQALGGASTAVGIQAYIETPTDKTYKLLLRSPIPFEIDDVITQTESGTCAVTVSIDATPLGGTANAASTTEDTQAHETANAVAVGQTVSVTVSENASAAGLSISINGTKVSA